MNVLERDDHLLKTKLILKLTEEFTDEQAEKVFLETEVKSEMELIEILEYLRNFRPKIHEKYSAGVQS